MQYKTVTASFQGPNVLATAQGSSMTQGIPGSSLHPLQAQPCPPEDSLSLAVVQGPHTTIILPTIFPLHKPFHGSPALLGKSPNSEHKKPIDDALPPPTPSSHSAPAAPLVAP